MNNETGELEIDLLRMAQALWKKAVGIVIAGVLAAAAALGYTAFFVTPLYKAEALMYVNSNNISVGSTKVSISQAELSAPDFCPSTCYENCPFSVTESLALGTPVLGADIGGIPELIQPGWTGELFESGSAEDLTRKIRTLWERPERTKRYSENCAGANLMGLEDYISALLELYQHKHTRRTNQ